MTGLRRDQLRGFEIRADEIEGLLAGTATPSAIDPDDLAVLGTSARYAHEDHQHAILAGAPDALERRTSNAEGTSSSFARADHDHATSAIGWGLLPSGRFTSTSNDSARAAGVDTDMTVTVALSTGRLYGALLHSQVDYGTTTASYALELEHNSTIIARIYRWTPNDSGPADSDVFVSAMVPFTVASGGISEVMTVSNAAGSGGTITMTAAATLPRTFAIFDLGPA